MMPKRQRLFLVEEIWKTEEGGMAPTLLFMIIAYSNANGHQQDRFR